jgi:hypothetical protein
MNEDKLNIISTTVHCERVKRRLPEKKTTSTLYLREIYGLSIKQNSTPACISTTWQKKQKTRREKRGHINWIEKEKILPRNVIKEERISPRQQQNQRKRERGQEESNVSTSYGRRISRRLRVSLEEHGRNKSHRKRGALVDLRKEGRRNINWYELVPW